MFPGCQMGERLIRNAWEPPPSGARMTVLPLPPPWNLWLRRRIIPFRVNRYEQFNVGVNPHQRKRGERLRPGRRDILEELSVHAFI